MIHDTTSRQPAVRAFLLEQQRGQASPPSQQEEEREEGDGGEGVTLVILGGGEKEGEEALHAVRRAMLGLASAPVAEEEAAVPHVLCDERLSIPLPLPAPAAASHRRPHDDVNDTGGDEEGSESSGEVEGEGRGGCCQSLMGLLLPPSATSSGRGVAPRGRTTGLTCDDSGRWVVSAAAATGLGHEGPGGPDQDQSPAALPPSSFPSRPADSSSSMLNVRLLTISNEARSLLAALGPTVRSFCFGTFIRTTHALATHRPPRQH